MARSTTYCGTDWCLLIWGARPPKTNRIVGLTFVGKVKEFQDITRMQPKGSKEVTVLEHGERLAYMIEQLGKPATDLSIEFK